MLWFSYILIPLGALIGLIFSYRMMICILDESIPSDMYDLSPREWDDDDSEW